MKLGFSPDRIKTMQRGLAIVTPVRDRLEHLLQTLPTWCAQECVSQVVICDFGSDPVATANIVSQSPKIKLVYAGQNEPWNKGLAQNIGIQASDHNIILKADCDVFFEDLDRYVSQVSQGSFVSGYMPIRELKVDKEKAGCFGQVIFKRQDWSMIGGYHEFMQGWGYDDLDSYNRLRDYGIPHRFFDLKDVRDIPHDDRVRGGARNADDIALAVPSSIRQEKEFQNMRNRLMAGIAPWTASLTRTKLFKKLDCQTYECILGPRSKLEISLQNVGAFLASRFFIQSDDLERELRTLLVDDRFLLFTAEATAAARDSL